MFIETFDIDPGADTLGLVELITVKEAIGYIKTF